MNGLKDREQRSRPNSQGNSRSPPYLKILRSHFTIDSRTTVTYIGVTLSDLDKQMTRFDSEVTQFNDFVKAQLDELRA